MSYLSIVLFLYVQYVHFLQRKYSLSSFNLLGHTAPAQAGSLIFIGPFLDYWLTNKRVDMYQYSTASLVRTTETHEFIFNQDMLDVIIVIFHLCHASIINLLLKYLKKTRNLTSTLNARCHMT